MIRLLLADNHPVVLQGLKTVLNADEQMQVVDEAQTGTELVEKANQHSPDVVLMELKLPKLDGLAVLRAFHGQFPRPKTILFTASDNKEEFVEAMKLGCSGILLKDSATPLIIKSIMKVYEGEIWLDANTTAAVIRHFASPAGDQGRPSANAGNGSQKPTRDRAQLSQREREIIILIAQGYKNKEIAEKMFITEQTVKNHLHNVFDKLGVSDRLELALYAIHNSLHIKA